MKKKIWFDLSNSPHINLFSDLIRDLEDSYDIVITTRPLGNSIELLKREKLPFTIVGKYYKRGKIKKTYAYFKRIYDLVNFLKKIDISLAVSQSSFHSPPVSAFLGIKSIYMNDNEHAQGNIPAFIFANKILLPEYFPLDVARKQFAKEKKIIRYPGLKEGIYLWNKENLFYSNNGGSTKKDTIYIRPEPWTAMYYKGEKNFLDETIKELSENEKIVILPRDDIQKKHYENLGLPNIATKAGLTLKEITSNCKLFIGAGGTMTRELAILGYPTISVYQDELLQVDKYLVNNHFMIHTKTLTKNFIYNYLSSFNANSNNELILKGKEAYNLLKQEIEELLSGD